MSNQNRVLCMASSVGNNEYELWFEKGKHKIYLCYRKNHQSTDALENKLLEIEDPLEAGDVYMVPLLESKNLTTSVKISGFTLIDSQLVKSKPPGLQTETMDRFNIPRVQFRDLTILRTESGGAHAELVEYNDKKYILKSALFQGDAEFLEQEVQNYAQLSQLDCIARVAGFAVSPTDADGGKEVDLGQGILLDYLPLGDLTQHYDASTSEKLVWMEQILQGVVGMEQCGYQHWDLKCENILLEDIEDKSQGARKIKIIDLANHGFTREWKHPTTINMVFSFGKTVQELFTGKKPSIGAVGEKELSALPEAAAMLVEACCNSEKVPKAIEVESLLRDNTKIRRVKDDIEKL